MTRDDKRIIEDYLPIEAISAEASREKSMRKGHISTLDLWWARRLRWLGGQRFSDSWRWRTGPRATRICGSRLGRG